MDIALLQIHMVHGYPDMSLGGIHQKYRALPRTSKPCTPILSLSNSILQYKEKVQ
jgi:hypothetical protein